MTAKEFLMQGWMIEKRIRKAEERLEILRARAASVRSSAPRTTPGGGRARAWTDAVEAVCDAEEALARQIAELYRLQKQITATIDAVPDIRLRTLLGYRYLCYMSWQRIADMMAYDVRTVTRLHGKALRLVAVPKCP